jgi:hypothetical protein
MPRFITKRYREVKKTKKKFSAPKPILGSYVQLKSLEEVCKLHGVIYWEDIYDPEIAEEMVELFGGKKIQVMSTRTSLNKFQGKDVRTGNVWYFRNDWIEDKRFEIGLIPDELFEI